MIYPTNGNIIDELPLAPQRDITAMWQIGLTWRNHREKEMRHSSVGPALFAGGHAISQLWLFIAAPIIGAVGAGLLFKTGKRDA